MKSLVFFGLVLIVFATGSGPQDKPSHDQNCPAKCAKCTAAVKKALDFLAGKQTEEGEIPAEIMKMNKKPLAYVSTDKTVSQVMTTAITGLGFLANGSTPTSGDYRERIKLIQGYLEKKLNDIFKLKGIGAGGGPAYSACLSLLFFTHIFEKEKDEQSRKLVPELVKYVSDRIGTKIGNSTWSGGGNNNVIWFVSGQTSLANLCVISLARAKAAGFEVKDEVFDLMKTYYPMIVEKAGAKYKGANVEGTMKYDKHNNFPNEPRRGRSISALLALECLGIHNDEQYKLTFDLARKNYDKTETHHVPSLQTTLCAFTYHHFGEDDWKKFIAANYEKLLGNQKEDGSLEKLWNAEQLKAQNPEQTMQPNDTAFGETYATANFALVLQVATGNVKFFK